MKFIFIILLLLIIPFINSCKDDDSFEDLTTETQEIETEDIETKEDSYTTGKIRVKFTEELALQIQSTLKSSKDSNITKTEVKSVDNALSSLNVTNLKRTLPYCGKFEKRTHESGLDRWYDITFDESESLTKANKDLSSIDGIDKVEYIPIFKISDNTEKDISSYTSINKYSNIVTNENNDIYPFNDPFLKYQWHYYNDGIDYTGFFNDSNMVKGCDINVLSVWKNFTTGDEDVIVAVIDYGIETSHEDLSSNIWENSSELNGTPGVDDDNNGYIDDLNGYNFVKDTGNIVGGNHGTHVAGTIGAVNNNGIDVCGIAGGDKENDIKGVSLMSCEIFEDYTDDDGETNTLQGNPVEAIKYAADNGAVIAQCSWGYSNPTSNDITSYEKEVIDYFVKYAGIDENGIQTGPMKGGVIIFAAGNDNNIYGPPGSYESAISVAAIAPDYQAASYTNYGDWVDIAAPGGDFNKGFIVSTIINNNIALNIGTSMACPHVSGVAALIVSYFGGSGFTNDMLKERLLNSANDIIYDYNDSKYTGYLGSGLVDARAAFLYGSTIAPDPVTTYSTSVVSNEITLTFTVPEDEDGIVPSGIKIYYSKNEIPTELDISNISDDISTITINTSNNSAGDEIQYTISDLDFSTTYYFALQSYDSSDNYSALSDCLSETTETNNPPVITSETNNDSIHYHENIEIEFTVSDPENNSYTISYETGSDAETFSSDDMILSIAGNKADEGTYSFILTATDEYGAKTTYAYNYTILSDNPPKATGEIEDIIFNDLSGSKTITLDDYFTDIDGETLTYNIEESDSTIANCSISDAKLQITPSEYGNTEITITASDAKGESCSLTFTVTVKNNPPVITCNTNSPINIHSYENSEITFNISDPEDQEITLSYETGSDAATFSSENLTLFIAGNKADEGTYNFTLTATDEYGAYTTYTFEYTILPNNPPTTTGEIENIVFNGISGNNTISLDDYFTDIDGETLTYNIEESNSSITNCSISDEKLQIAPSEYGNTEITITASDAKGESCSLTFKVLVRSNTNSIDVYPNPVTTSVNIRPEETINDVTITFTNTSGTIVKKINTDSTGPFSPVEVNLSDIAAGVYTVKITSSGNDQFSSSIIKL